MLQAVRPQGQWWEMYGRYVVAICCYLVPHGTCGRDLVDVATICRLESFIRLEKEGVGIARKQVLVVHAAFSGTPGRKAVERP
jgi:hypothetical protein